MPATKTHRSPAPLPKLPRGGRHPLTQEAVASSQRTRMLGAVAQAVAQKGYAAATVADVIARAGLTTYLIEGEGLNGLAEQLKDRPGIDQVAAFGTSLHVVGKDKAKAA